MMRRHITPDSYRLGSLFLLLVAAILAPLGARAAMAADPTAGSASAPTSDPTLAPDALKVVTTTTVFADIVKNVGREHVDAVSIIPSGVGPEDYEPKPADAILLDGAALIVSNGVGLDDYLDKLLQSGSGGGTPQLVLGEGIPTLTLDGAENPHFWLDPTLVEQYYLPAIVAKLAALDPANAAAYAADAADYATQLEALDADLKTLVEQIPPENRKLVTFHDAYPYLARHYGFELIGVILENVGSEPSAAELAALVEKVRSAGVKAVFSEAQFSPELARTLANEAGITSVVTTIYNDALGPAPADTYLGMMRYDIEQMVQALR